MTTQRARVGRLLVKACSVRPAGEFEGLDDEGIDLLERAVAWHQVSGHVYRAYRDLLPASTTARLKDDDRTAAMRQLLAVADLAWVQELLGTDQSWLLLKGPALSRFYEDPSIRRFGDLDVLVRPEAIGAAIERLRADGTATMVDRNWALMRRAGVGQFHFVLPSGTPLDLHWHLLNHRRLRRQFTVDPGPIFDRAESVTVDGREVLTMSHVDTLVHTALHAAISGGNVLRWFCDIDRVVRAADLDWDAVVHRTREWSATFSVGTILWRTRELFDTPIPASVIKELVPSIIWRCLILATQTVSPVEVNDGRHSLTRIVARSGRKNLRASAGQLSVRTVARAYDRTDGRTLWEHLNPGSLATPAGSSGDLADLIRTIETTGRPSIGAGESQQ